MLTGCRAKMVMHSCSIVSWLIASAAATGGGGKNAAAGRIAADGRIDGGLLDLRRAMTGGRLRMMPLCGGAATTSSTGLSKVRWENIGGMLGKLV